jgi:hypothetical protein
VASKTKIPNHKHKIPNNFQFQNSNVQNKGVLNAAFLCVGHWVIGICDLFGICCLELGI